MSRAWEAFTRLVLHERLLGSFEKRVVTGKEAVVDLFLRKGTKYVVRARVSRGRGTPSLSLTDADGTHAHTDRSVRGARLSVIPEEAGLYRVRGVVSAARRNEELVTLSITLSCAVPPPQYMTYRIVASSCGFARIDLAGEDREEGEYGRETIRKEKGSRLKSVWRALIRFPRFREFRS